MCRDAKHESTNLATHTQHTKASGAAHQISDLSGLRKKNWIAEKKKKIGVASRMYVYLSNQPDSVHRHSAAPNKGRLMADGTQQDRQL